jgi:hypothetical protein
MNDDLIFVLVLAALAWLIWSTGGPQLPVPQTNNSELTGLDMQGLPLESVPGYSDPNQYLVTQDVPGSDASQY